MKNHLSFQGFRCSLRAMKIKIAYSPDTDDAFMLEPLRTQKINWGKYEFEFHRGDIQNLNQQALNEKYDITAVSVGALPLISNHYGFMEVGCSIGRNFGPKLVTKVDSEVYYVSELKGKRIATPGPHTSAYIASLGLFPEYVPIHASFDKIETLVRSGFVDAGILIHELQVAVDGSNLWQVADLGMLWHDKYQMPLPLGANAIKLSLPEEDRHQLEYLLYQSVAYAQQNWEEVLKVAMESSVKGFDMSQTQGKQYIDMYANSDSLKVENDTKNGIRELFNIAKNYKIYEPEEINRLNL